MMEEELWFRRGVKNGWIGRYEKEMLHFLNQEYDETNGDVWMSILFLLLFLKAGHVCLPLNRTPSFWAAHLDLPEDDQTLFESKMVSVDILEMSDLIGKEGSFIIRDNSLYSKKFDQLEEETADFLLCQSVYAPEKLSGSVDADIIQNLFEGQKMTDIMWQKAALILTFLKNLIIISGGPGTGKTTTVAKIIRFLGQFANKPLHIALAAPTGKAAARMGEALKQKGLFSEQKGEKSWIFSEPKTLHRLLWPMQHKGLLPPSTHKYLPHDIVIVDEASMIDLELMHRLLRHIHPKTKLILIGDKDQLASVEAGAVFSDLCAGSSNSFQPDTSGLLNSFGIKATSESKLGDIGDCTVVLEKSWRFDKQSGIGQLAAFVQHGGHQAAEGDAANQPSLFEESEERWLDPLTRFFSDEEFKDLNQLPFSYEKEHLQFLLKALYDKLEACANQTPEEMLTHWQKDAWLAVLRHGRYGVNRLNQMVEEFISMHKHVVATGDWYHGKPVMITKNDYRLNVFNGDLGVCVIEEGRPMVCFQDEANQLRKIPADQLKQSEAAYILTVHKSQGSEFDHVHFLLPDKKSPLLSRELIYTALTRARKSFTLYGSPAMFKEGIKQPTIRYTGLKYRLHNQQNISSIDQTSSLS